MESESLGCVLPLLPAMPTQSPEPGVHGALGIKGEPVPKLLPFGVQLPLRLYASRDLDAGVREAMVLLMI